MQTLWYHYDFASTPLQFSIMAMNLGQEGGDAESRKSDTQYMQTFGTYIKYAPGQWNLSGSFYYQSGKNVSSRSVSAFMGSARASYNINKSWSVNVGTDYLSGMISLTEHIRLSTHCMEHTISFMGQWIISMLLILLEVITQGFPILRLELVIRCLLQYRWE